MIAADPLAGALLSCGLGLVVGAALNHGGTCAVGAARSLTRDGNARPSLGLAVALGAAGLVVLPMVWVSGGTLRVATSVPLDARLVLGGVLLAIGALINGACILGSLTRVGDGEARFLLLPLGLGIGFAAARSVGMPVRLATRSALAAPTVVSVAWVLGFGLLAAVATVAIAQRREAGDARRLIAASLVLGIGGALLFLLRPGWSYADLVHQRFAASMQVAGAPATGAALATIAGSALSALHRRAFRLQLPRGADLARPIVGGAVMAFGAVLVPGGNDALLLSAVPAGVPSGILAYLVMSATVFLACRAGAIRTAKRKVSAPL